MARGRAADGTFVITTYNVGAGSDDAHMGPLKANFRTKLQKDLEHLCNASHVVCRLELNREHAEWLRRGNLRTRWYMGGDSCQKSYVLWDARDLRLVYFAVKWVFPRPRRQYLSAHASNESNPPHPTPVRCAVRRALRRWCCHTHGARHGSRRGP